MTQDDLLKYNIEHVKNSIPGIEKKAGATKEQLATFLDTSIASINRSMKDGYGIPEYIKGKRKGQRVFFPLINIALFLTNSTMHTA